MYYCKNCGEPYMTDETIMCIKCGAAKGQGNKYCQNCGKPLAPDAPVCLNCGVANQPAPGSAAVTTDPEPNYYQDHTADMQSQPVYQQPQSQNNGTNTLAVISLVLGIISIVLGCSCGCAGWLAVLFGVGGIVCAVFADKQWKTELARAGLICSIVGIVLGVLTTIFAVVVWAAFATEIGSYY